MGASERHHGWAYEHSRWTGCVVHMAKLTEMSWKAVPRAKRSWRACLCEGEREGERELYDYFRQFHWPTKQSWADELALFNFNWSQLAETLISNGTMQYNPMSSTVSLNLYWFLSNCGVTCFALQVIIMLNYVFSWTQYIHLVTRFMHIKRSYWYSINKPHIEIDIFFHLKLNN